LLNHRRQIRIHSKGLTYFNEQTASTDKEPTVRFTVDMSETFHYKLSMLVAKTGCKKVDILRMLLEDGFKGVNG
jgi:hypothetical protein